MVGGGGDATHSLRDAQKSLGRHWLRRGSGSECGGGSGLVLLAKAPQHLLAPKLSMKYSTSNGKPANPGSERPCTCQMNVFVGQMQSLLENQTTLPPPSNFNYVECI